MNTVGQDAGAREARIPVAVDSVMKRATEVHGALQSLTQRLSSVLKPEAPTNNAKPDDSRAKSHGIPLVAQIEEVGGKVDQCRAVVDEILARLEV